MILATAKTLSFIEQLCSSLRHRGTGIGQHMTWSYSVPAEANLGDIKPIKSAFLEEKLGV